MFSPGWGRKIVFILGLTGSIAMGKTTASEMFRRLGVPVHDSDASVHALMALGGAAVVPVERAFPGVVEAGAVNRQQLGEMVFGDPEALGALEGIIHPMVRGVEKKFLANCARRRTSLVLLDVPLLFEAGGYLRCDAVAVVTAPARMQRQRAMSRPGMTAEKFNSIKQQQLSDAEKRRRSNFIIQTGLGKTHSLRTIRKIVTLCQNLPATHWPPKR